MFSLHARLVGLASLLGAALAVHAAGATIKAASCAQEDVQKAMDEARDGDTVEVPAGTAVWKSTGPRKPAVLLSGKTVTLKGAGIDRTIITDGNTVAWQDLLLHIQGTKPARVTGFTFKGVWDQNAGAAAIAVHGDCQGWRIDHCKFDGSPRGVWAYAGCFGLVDHCTFANVGQGVVMKGQGDASWDEPLTLGTARAVYIEDCTFAGGNSLTDGYHGARYVFRHNTATGTRSLGHHGCDSGGYRSTFSYEIYENRITTAKNWAWAMHFRGGTGVVFNNTLADSSGGVDVANYRSSSSEAMAKLCKSWGLCDGRNPVDGNEEPNGYPARDQIGRTCRQLLEPLYQWRNTLNGAPVRISVSTGKQHILENRDFYNDTPRPGYKPYRYPHPLQEQWPPLPPADSQAPSVPEELAARAIAERDVELTWRAATDNEAVAGYYVWLDGAKVTTITDPSYTKYTFRRLKAPLPQHTFAVSAFDAAGNEGKPTAPGVRCEGTR